MDSWFLVLQLSQNSHTIVFLLFFNLFCFCFIMMKTNNSKCFFSYLDLDYHIDRRARMLTVCCSARRRPARPSMRRRAPDR